jgi:hypothetical protein
VAELLQNLAEHESVSEITRDYCAFQSRKRQPYLPMCEAARLIFAHGTWIHGEYLRILDGGQYRTFELGVQYVLVEGDSKEWGDRRQAGARDGARLGSYKYQ